VINLLVGIHCLDRLTWLYFLFDVKTELCMTDFDLPQNFTQSPSHLCEEFDLVSYLLRFRSRQSNQLLLRQKLPTLWPRRCPVIFFAPSADNVPVGPKLNIGGQNSEI
jgi:hypothetical protein